MVLPTSQYDRIDEDERFFTWSTPADEGLTPWRVSWPSRLHRYIADSDVGMVVDDLFVDYHSRGLEVWLRDNSHAGKHYRRTVKLHRWLRDNGVLVRFVREKPCGVPTHLIVRDDLQDWR